MDIQIVDELDKSNETLISFQLVCLTLKWPLSGSESASDALKYYWPFKT